jgi:broad specificity phosphatase PhoE
MIYIKMVRLFVLRHEKRSPSDATFEASLTEKGTQNAQTLALKLADHVPSFTHIYSSPFLRCLQTIAPFCRRQQMCVRRDFALYERMSKATTPRDNSAHFRLDVVPSHPLYHLLDTQYLSSSSIPLDAIQPEESVAEVQARATIFATFVQQHHSAHDVVLAVTHMSVVNALLHRADNAPYAMGALEECTGVDGGSVAALH